LSFFTVYLKNSEDTIEKNSSLFDSDARKTYVLSESTVTSTTILKSNTTQNTSLDSSNLKKNKIVENSQNKKAGPLINNPPPFKIQNKNVICFNNPTALFESNWTQSSGKSSLFD